MTAQDRTYTIVEYEEFVAQHPNKRIELVDGDIVEKMPTQLHAYIVGMIAHFVIAYLLKNPIGSTLVEARYSLPDDEENTRVPDLSFVSKDKGALVKVGAAPYMPDLAVEVQSPGQSDRFMAERATYYLANGSLMVWLVYPEKMLVEVLTLDERYLLTQNDSIDGGDVLPGFSVEVNSLFPNE